MDPSNSSPRRRRDPALGAEALEPRELLTGGMGNTFAIVPATISQAGGTAAVKFTIDPSHFTLPKHALILGIDVVPDSSASSPVKPDIASVTYPSGKPVPGVTHATYARVAHTQVLNGRATTAALAPITLNPADPTQPVTYTVNIQAQGNTSGKFLIGFYLPGDANGDGKVDSTDLTALKAALGSKSGGSRYNFQADVNRDGRIDRADLSVAQQNMGVSTDITPAVSANLDPVDTNGLVGDTSTYINPVHYTGTATPGATVAFTDLANNATTATTADSSGNFSIMVPLVEGSNTFQVSATDGFGQTVKGTITPVNYNSRPSAFATNTGTGSSTGTTTKTA